LTGDDRGGRDGGTNSAIIAVANTAGVPEPGTGGLGACAMLLLGLAAGARKFHWLGLPISVASRK